MLLARTDPDVPKHRGISYFAIDMHQPGVDVRPLREMTGPGAVQRGVPDRRPGAPTTRSSASRNNGWAVGNTTLMFERAGLGAGGGGAASAASPGTIDASPRETSRRLHRSTAAGLGRWRQRTRAGDGVRDRSVERRAVGSGVAPGPDATALHAADRPVQQPAAQGGERGRPGHPRAGQPVQADHEPDDAPRSRPRPAHPRAGRSTGRRRCAGRRDARRD